MEGQKHHADRSTAVISRLATGIAKFLIDQLVARALRLHGKLHSASAERMSEKIAVTSSVMSVKTQNKTRPELTTLGPTSPVPIM